MGILASFELGLGVEGFRAALESLLRSPLNTLFSPQYAFVGSSVRRLPSLDSSRSISGESVIPNLWLSVSGAETVNIDAIGRDADAMAAELTRGPSSVGLRLFGNTTITFCHERAQATGQVFRDISPIASLPTQVGSETIVLDRRYPPKNHLTWQAPPGSGRSDWNPVLELVLDTWTDRRQRNSGLHCRFMLASAAYITYEGADHLNFTDDCRHENWSRLLDVLEQLVHTRGLVTNIDGSVDEVQDQLSRGPLLARVQRLLTG